MKAMDIVLGIGIAVILFLVIILGIRTFYPLPEIDDLCGKDLHLIKTEQACIDAGGDWLGGEPLLIGRCGPKQECFSEFEAVRDKWGGMYFL